MSMIVSVPTCNYSEYKLLSPYDSDLQSAFNFSLASDFKNRDDLNRCSMCKENMKDIGYSNDLYNCSECLGFTSDTSKYPILSKTWGCDTCESVVAPVSYYENKKMNVVASPEKLADYLNDVTYRENVDNLWNSLSICERGTIIKKICINKDIGSYSIKVPLIEQGQSNGQETSLSNKMIVMIVILVLTVIFIAHVSYYLIRFDLSKQFLDNYGFTKYRFLSDGFIVYLELIIIVLLTSVYFVV